MSPELPPAPPPSDLPARPLGVTGSTLLVAWLIPGLGHILHRDIRRGLILFFLVEGVFVVGLLFHGAVLWPALSPQDWGFNAVNILTFIIQLANGLASLLCLAISGIYPAWSEATRAHTLFELGTVYLLMAGAINSFAVGGVYDRHLRRGRPEGTRG
ncbi:hypothetical protein JXA47_09335 [Candidatus Sumerlaeota bacterium]|nr:hypothetical protein [Candidatus Sumerlaeota bacterium]